MKDRIVLGIKRNRSRLDVFHNNELIGRIEVSEANRGNQCSLIVSGDRSKTYFKIVKEELSDDMWNKEEFNK